jgi:hypothetical protein
MTPEQRAQLFGQIFGLLDSDQPGERATALDKLHSLREKMGWPTFGDVLRKLENTVSAAQLEAAEQSAAQWQRENAALAQRNAMLVARIATLRAALWFTRNWTKAAATVIVIGVGSWQCSSRGTPPDQQTVSTTSAKDTARAAVDSALRDLLKRSSWSGGETAPFIVMVSGVPYWVIIRGTIDAQSHADAHGQPIKRHCLQLFAAEAARDAGAFVTPSPYVAFGVWMKWPQRAADCRMPGTGNYQNEQGNVVDLTQHGSHQG